MGLRNYRLKLEHAQRAKEHALRQKELERVVGVLQQTFDTLKETDRYEPIVNAMRHIAAAKTEVMFELEFRYRKEVQAE